MVTSEPDRGPTPARILLCVRCEAHEAVAVIDDRRLKPRLPGSRWLIRGVLILPCWLTVGCRSRRGPGGTPLTPSRSIGLGLCQAGSRMGLQPGPHHSPPLIALIEDLVPQLQDQ